MGGLSGRRAPLLWGTLLMVGSCAGDEGSSANPRPESGAFPSAGSERAAALEPPEVREVTQEEPAREVVSREVVEAVLEQGMGRLLQHVQVEPAREQGRFVGHRVVAIHPAWAGGPVRVGDVVVRLNGSTLESPDKAHAAVGTLRVASELVLEVIRDGEPTRLRLAID